MQRQALPLILLTRPEAASARFAARINAVHPGAEVLISPLQLVQMLDWHPPAGPLPEALIFTSQHAVVPAVKAGLGGLAYCVGNDTAAAAAAAGFRAVSAGGDAGDLAALILSQSPRRLWHLRGARGSGDLAQTLQKGGRTVKEVAVYGTTPLSLTSRAQEVLGGTRLILLPLFSPHSAALAAKSLAGHRAPVRVLALSPAVGQAASPISGGNPLVAAQPDAEGMLEILAEALNSGT